ncbi:MAG: hypothetical protein M0R38_10825 [Bacteroidia bacterium]|nr:hypothetical protein [Bacteroidia bacterium]
MLGGLVLSHIEDILEKQNIDLINFDKPQSFTKLDMAEVDDTLNHGKVVLVSGNISKNQNTWKLIA